MSSPSVTTPNILALDTAGESCSVALLWQGKTYFHIEDNARRHAQELLPLCDVILKDAGVGLAQLDAIAVNAGPGSFTGLRIGMSAAQGLAISAGLPIVAVSGLAALAHAASPGATDDGAVLLSVIDARMNEVYAAFWRCNGGILTRCGDDALVPPERLQLPTGVDWPQVCMVGSGACYADRIAGSEQARRIDGDARHSAQEVLRISQAQYARGEYVAPMNAEPVYLRNSVTG